MTDNFQMGTSASIYDLLRLDEFLETMDIPIDPDWTFLPYSTNVRLGDLTLRGQGFSVVKWRWRGFALANREILRETFCPYPALSADGIYIHTPIANTSSGLFVWKTFRTIMNWPDQEEDFQADKVLDFTLTFTALEEVVE
jgi:hypothetical protein